MSGTINGTLVTVTSTGIGGPSAAIAIEELAQLGAHTFIRIGTSGAMQRDLHIGDLVIATAAIRDEGTSNHYVPLAFPAVSDYRVVSSLVETATALGHSFQVGVVHSKDSFYGQHEAQRMPIAVELEQRWQTWIRAGALCSEMESAAVFSVAGAALGLRAGAVIAVAGNQESGEHLDDETALRHRDDGIKRAIECGIGAISRLIELDSIAQ